MKENLDAYKDIIDLPHHVSQNRTQMPLTERAAQFAPFAALTGFEDDVEETERITDARIEITEDALREMDERMSSLYERISQRPEIILTVFEKDEKKTGGRYTEVSGRLKRIDEIQRVLYLTDGRSVPLKNVVDIREYEE
ncbi:MAG: hypothetical protein K6G60_00105 [Lachnospiraceae bacterium]|nr:hypothetical protein [Lachnospiraceae bacterium]